VGKQFLADLEKVRDQQVEAGDLSDARSSMGVVGRSKLTPGSPRVDRAWFQRLKLNYDKALSSSALKFNLRR